VSQQSSGISINQILLNSKAKIDLIALIWFEIKQFSNFSTWQSFAPAGLRSKLPSLAALDAPTGCKNPAQISAELGFGQTL